MNAGSGKLSSLFIINYGFTTLCVFIEHALCIWTNVAFSFFLFLVNYIKRIIIFSTILNICLIRTDFELSTIKSISIYFSKHETTEIKSKVI